MSHTKQSPAMIIRREHQSAPKETALDKAVKRAAEEIDGGRWLDDDTVPEKALEGLGLALTSGPMAEVQRKTARMGLDAELARGIEQTRDLNKLGRHPRVQEALERLQAETDEGKNHLEVMERQWKIWEMTEGMAAKNKWDGQERWQGRENEEMRMGQVMAPGNFYSQLIEVIGPGRIYPSFTPDKYTPGDETGRIGLFIPNPNWDGREPREYKNVQLRKIREAGQEHFKLAKRYKLLGLTAKAEVEMNLAAEAGETAMKMVFEAQQDLERNPEMLRVATLQWPGMTEWMIMRFDEFGVPTEPRFLGWRTALLTMIRCRAITEEEAHVAFPVSDGPAAGWYLEQLQRMRQPEEGPVLVN